MKQALLLFIAFHIISCAKQVNNTCNSNPCNQSVQEQVINNEKKQFELETKITQNNNSGLKVITSPPDLNKSSEKFPVTTNKTSSPANNEINLTYLTPTLTKPDEARVKIASEFNIRLSSNQYPLVDTHSDRALHGDMDGPLAKPFSKVVNKIFPNWGPFITEKELTERGHGVQVMSVPTDGLPPFYFSSQKLYSKLVAGKPEITSITRLNRVIEQTAFSYRWVNKNPDKLTIAWSYEEVAKAFRENKTALIPAIEGAQFLVPEGGYGTYGDYEKNLKKYIESPDNGIPANYPIPTIEEVSSIDGLLQWARRVGVIYIGLNHLGSNLFSGADNAVKKGSGLTPKGIEVIQSMQKQGILLDLSHASQAAQKQIKDLKLQLPILVSHGIITLEGEKPDWRHTVPEALEEVKRTGGVFGVMFATQYLPNGTLNDIVNEIKILRSKIGIEHIAIGTDADGFVNLAIKDMKGVNQVFDALRKENFTEEDIARISFGNFLRMLKKRDEILLRE